MQKLIDSQMPLVPEYSGSAILSTLEEEIESSGPEETRMAAIPTAQPFSQERFRPLAVGVCCPDPPQSEESWRGVKEPMPWGFGKIGGGGAGVRHSEGIWCFYLERHVYRQEDCENCRYFEDGDCMYFEKFEEEPGESF